MGQRQPLAVVADAAAVTRRIAGFNEVAPAVVYVVFGEGVRPLAVFGALGAAGELAPCVVGA